MSHHYIWMNKVGSIALLYHNKLTLIKRKPYDFDSMECTNFRVSLPGPSLNMAVIFHPPDTSVLSFVDQLTDYMEWNVDQPGKMLLLGDFSIKVNDKEDPDTMTFSNFLESFWHVQLSFLPSSQT